MNRLFLFLLLTALVVVSGFMYFATTSQASHVLTVNKLAESPNTTKTRIRIGGRVTSDPIKYEVEPSFKLTFSVQDPASPAGSIPVVYEGIRPDMFEAGRDVLLDGDFKEGTFFAAQLLTQCPSKYEPPKAPQ